MAEKPTTYIQGYDVATLKSHQSRTAEVQADYLLPHIKPTSQILDVGCGPGTISCDLARHVPEGKVVGIDFSDKVLEQARTEATARELKNITFRNASAHNIPYEDDSFDIVHCHALLVHMPHAVDAIKEMRRVCKPGGYVAAREPDWDTLVIHPHSEVLEKWKAISARLKRNEGAEPNAGRHLAEWAISAGFAPGKVIVTCNVLQYFTQDERKFWGQLYAERVHTEFGQRAASSGIVTSEDLDQFASEYMKWGNGQSGLWMMVHMRMLCQK